MTDDVVPLDGNGAAGHLGALFAFDVTLVAVTCGSCSWKGPLAELRLYGRGAGLVLRCRRCNGVNIRTLVRGATVNLDFSGTALLSIQTGSG